MTRLARLISALALLVVSVLPVPAVAHNVPGAVEALVFLKPEGDHLTMLVRAPTKSLRDIDIPMRETGFLDPAGMGDALRFGAQVWIRDFIEVYENGVRLPRPEFVAARATPAIDRPFEDFEQALAQIRQMPLDPALDLTWDDGFIEVAYRYPIVSEHSNFAIDPGMTRLGVHVNVLLRMLFADGRERIFDVTAGTGTIELDPTVRQTFALFLEEGLNAIIGNTDYLLFLFALVLPFRRVGPIAVVVGGFTAAHALTLIASALGLAPVALWFGPLVHALLAASILCVALDNLFTPSLRRRLWAAVGFGLAYGFAFAFLLLENLQLAGSHPQVAVISFVLGIELGQLIALAVMVPLLALLFRRVIPERLGIILVSALIAHSVWHATAERAAVLLLFPFPEMDAQALTRLIWWLIAAVSIATLLRLVSDPVSRFDGGTPQARRVPPGE